MALGDATHKLPVKASLRDCCLSKRTKRQGPPYRASGQFIGEALRPWMGN